MSQAAVTHRRNVQAVEPEEIPAELLQRRDNVVRYARGGPLYATDGLVGHLSQVIVDPAAGTVAEIVVKLPDDRRIVLPLDLVDRTAGTAIFLSADRAAFAQVVTRAPAFDGDSFGKANLKALKAVVAKVTDKAPRRGIDQVGDDYVVTPANALIERLGHRES
ncbi:MAG: hypothetical protein H0U40_06875 [Chloroflexia bacterium]|nr:hypothetical protein [Chloroflexia bacterium]MDQ3515094.1 hypothetical protein [Chloroflexota bacterium]